ncbi:MAG: adenylosuccinate lyase, partial [Spirochaetales bacterium]|nr:adenylosuccinate lyase [Spirochaetales bacterium]
MESYVRSVYDNISPLDHRYFLSNRDVFAELGAFLSENAGVRYFVRVEGALLKAHFSAGAAPSREVLEAVEALPDVVTPDEVYGEEERTQHNIRALVNVIK